MRNLKFLMFSLLMLAFIFPATASVIKVTEQVSKNPKIEMAVHFTQSAVLNKTTTMNVFANELKLFKKEQSSINRDLILNDCDFEVNAIDKASPGESYFLNSRKDNFKIRYGLNYDSYTFRNK